MAEQKDSTDKNPSWEVVEGGLLVNGKVYTKLNLACGVPLEKRFPEWLNIDAQAGAADLVMRIDKLPLTWTGLFGEVRASHVLEHFTLNEAHAVMKEWSRVTAPGGKLRVCVPDLALFVEAYVNGNKDRKGREAVSVEHTTHMLTQIFGRGYEDREMNPFMRHHMVYDEEMLGEMFIMTGEAAEVKVYTVEEDPSQQFDPPIKNDASNRAYTLNMFMRKYRPGEQPLQMYMKPAGLELET